MNIDYLIYIVALMIFYDLSIHFVYLIRKEDFFLKRRLNWWPRWDLWGIKGEKTLK